MKFLNEARWSENRFCYCCVLKNGDVVARFVINNSDVYVTTRNIFDQLSDCDARVIGGPASVSIATLLSPKDYPMKNLQHN